MKQELLARYVRLVTRVEQVDYVRREEIELYKAKLILADGSNLRVSEVWIDGELTKYAYYWLNEKDELIRGWDNAPHHLQMSRTHTMSTMLKKFASPLPGIWAMC